MIHGTGEEIERWRKGVMDAQIMLWCCVWVIIQIFRTSFLEQGSIVTVFRKGLGFRVFGFRV